VLQALWWRELQAEAERLAFDITCSAKHLPDSAAPCARLVCMHCAGDAAAGCGTPYAAPNTHLTMLLLVHHLSAGIVVAMELQAEAERRKRVITWCATCMTCLHCGGWAQPVHTCDNLARHMHTLCCRHCGGHGAAGGG
jgi:hypothetical protein